MLTRRLAIGPEASGVAGAGAEENACGAVAVAVAVAVGMVVLIDMSSGCGTASAGGFRPSLLLLQTVPCPSATRRQV